VKNIPVVKDADKSNTAEEHLACPGYRLEQLLGEITGAFHMTGPLIYQAGYAI